MLNIVKQFSVPFVMSEPVLVSYVDDEGETRTYEYAPDFLIMRKLPIECDGPHHRKGKQPFKDERKDRILKTVVWARAVTVHGHGTQRRLRGLRTHGPISRKRTTKRNIL